MPDLVGRPAVVALSELNARGFTDVVLSEQEQPGPIVEAQVVSQTPAPGKPIGLDTPIRLRAISSGAVVPAPAPALGAVADE